VEELRSRGMVHLKDVPLRTLTSELVSEGLILQESLEESLSKRGRGRPLGWVPPPNFSERVSAGMRASRERAVRLMDIAKEL